MKYNRYGNDKISPGPKKYLNCFQACFETYIYCPAPLPAIADMTPTRFQGMNDVRRLVPIYKFHNTEVRFPMKNTLFCR